jgi:hypothetical protein
MQDGGEREEEREGQEMGVEEVFAPVGAVGCVGILDVDAHVCGEDLSGEENQEARAEISTAGFHGFALCRLCQQLLLQKAGWGKSIPYYPHPQTHSPTPRESIAPHYPPATH